MNLAECLHYKMTDGEKMTVRKLLCTLLMALSMTTAFAQEKLSYTFEEALELPGVKRLRLQEPGIKLYFGTVLPSEVAEITRPDNFSDRSIRLYEGCELVIVDIFSRLYKEARQQGFDAIAKIRPLRNDKPDDAATVIVCDRGRAATTLTLSATFAMTPEASRTNAVRQSQPQRRTEMSNAMRLPMAEVVAQPEIQQLIARHGVVLHVGLSKTPTYFERMGPENFEESVRVDADGPEVACRKAATIALRDMINEAVGEKFFQLVRLGSYLKDQPAPSDSEYECAIERGRISTSAAVVLRSLFTNPPRP
ncbi:MAG: hypothetical protein QM776_15015 [Rhodocyclaceae bacterium]